MPVFCMERKKGYTVMSNYHLRDKSLKAKGLLLQIAYVNLGTVLREKSLTPETYIPAAQADIVRKALDSCSTIAELVLRLSHIIQTGGVVLSSNGGKYTG